MKRRTSKKKFAKKSKEIHRWIRKKRQEKAREIIAELNRKLTGYYQYYGITDNYKSLDRFVNKVRKSLYKWLNRRSQKESYTWKGYLEMLKENPLTRPKIYVNVYEG